MEVFNGDSEMVVMDDTNVEDLLRKSVKDSYF
jgi:hypothetical protein